MDRQPPTQELVAKDLHGVDWRFRHIFRGQPRRHLLQSGWSVFVSAKRLVAGDAFIFLRGENDELRVGVRRAMRQLPNVPPSVISSHSMHLGVLATAWHAVNTGTMFTVYYKPRTSPSEFIVPYDKYMESIKSNYSTGIRFKMRFEGEEAPEQRFAGTVVGVGDVDTNRWAGSSWRCLKVRWDETSSISRPERVSPWQIEPAMTPPPPNSLLVARSKRPRTNTNTVSVETSVLTNEVTSKVHINASQGISRVLHGQESINFRTNCADVIEAEQAQKSSMRSSSHNEIGSFGSVHRLDSEGQSLGVRHGSSYGDLLFRTLGASQALGSSLLDQKIDSKNLLRSNFQDPVTKQCATSGTWSLINQSSASNLELNLMPTHLGKPSNPELQTYGGSSSSIRHEFEQPTPNWFMHLLPTYKMENQTQTRALTPQSCKSGDIEMVKHKETGNCKLFGVQLNSSPLISELPLPQAIASHDLEVHCQPTASLQLSQNREDCHIDFAKNLKPMDTASADTVKERDVICSWASKEIHGKPLGSTTRSCTKVHRQGSALGRSVDLSKLSNYEDLVAELDCMFDFKGELLSPTKHWLVVYTDDEGDMMLVGDDPWGEFCNMVRKINIYTREEVQKMNPNSLNSSATESLAPSEDG
ncbi:Auxin response factor 24 [Apostasia shenzhenica]|uniref:Auxin response factor n=1 Tax=Apostasia shenzhenica TaxID=1088818 RepID=A0A2I0AMT8_9ASPA|nr:Auxin response factor 24 [Apostasia shenzhenica]